MFDLRIDSCSDSEVIAKLELVASALLCNSTQQIAFIIEEDNGFSRVLELIARGSKDKSMNGGVLSASLLLLMNLTSNDTIGDHILKEEKATVTTLLLLLQAQNRDHCILAGRCLVNLTATSSAGWIVEEGALDVASKISCDPGTSIGLQKIAINILGNLTAPHASSGPRNTLACNIKLIKVLLGLLDEDAITGEHRSSSRHQRSLIPDPCVLIHAMI